MVPTTEREIYRELSRQLRDEIATLRKSNVAHQLDSARLREENQYLRHQTRYVRERNLELTDENAGHKSASEYLLQRLAWLTEFTRLPVPDIHSTFNEYFRRPRIWR
jgi:hypothetical protein